MPPIVPTDLLVLAPGPRPTWPALRERLTERRSGLHVRGVDEPEDDETIVFSAGIEFDAGPPLVLWAEPVRPGSAADLPPEAASCRWIVGGQTVLDAADPLGTLGWLVRTMVELVPDTPAVLDVNTMSWLDRSQLERLFLNTSVEPPLDQLWIVERLDRDGESWLRTHGLARCGRPEIAMEGVAPSLAGAAVAVINAVAGHGLETTDVLTPGGLVEIGPGLAVHLESSGDDLVVATPGATVWPRAAVEAVARDRVPLHIPPRVAARQAARARERWGDFCGLFEAATDREGLGFTVKATLTPDKTPGVDREHLWFEALAMDANGVRGCLLHPPLVTPGIQPGDERRLDLDAISDWRIVAGKQVFGPDQIDALWASRAEQVS